MLAAQFVERSEQCGGGHGLAIQRDAIALLEVDGDIFGRVRRVFGIDRARINVIRRFIPRIFEHFAFG